MTKNSIRPSKENVRFRQQKKIQFVWVKDRTVSIQNLDNRLYNEATIATEDKNTTRQHLIKNSPSLFQIHKCDLNYFKLLTKETCLTAQ